MRTNFPLSLLLGCVVVLCVATWVSAAGPGAPTRLLPYQGHLDQDGAPVTGSVDMTFRLVDDAVAAASTLSWSETMVVDVVGGQFSVLLGQTTPIGNTVLDAAELFLTIEVDGVLLGGVQRVAPSLQALRTDRALNLVASTVNAGSVAATSVSTTGNVSVGGSVTAGHILHTCPYSDALGVAYGTATCSCPVGTRVISGGAKCQSDYIYESRPVSTTAWRVSCAAGNNWEFPKWVQEMTLICARIE